MKSIVMLPVWLTLCAAGCSDNVHRQTEPVKGSSPVTHDDVSVEFELRLSWGGAITRKLERDLKYRPLSVIVVAGASPASVHRGNRGAAYVYVVGINSSQGRAVQEILGKEQPWNWQGLKNMYSFANGLFLDYSDSDNSWEYVSVYPDPKLAALLNRIRTALRSSQEDGFPQRQRRSGLQPGAGPMNIGTTLGIRCIAMNYPNGVASS